MKKEKADLLHFPKSASIDRSRVTCPEEFLPGCILPIAFRVALLVPLYFPSMVVTFRSFGPTQSRLLTRTFQGRAVFSDQEAHDGSVLGCHLQPLPVIVWIH